MTARELLPFKGAQAVILKGGKGYGSMKCHYSLKGDFPRKDGNPYWTLETTHEGLMVPYANVIVSNSVYFNLVLYLPIKELMQKIETGEMVDFGVATSLQAGSYNINHSAKSATGKAQGNPIIGYKGVTLNSNKSRADATVDLEDLEVTPSQIWADVFAKQTEIYDNLNGLILNGDMHKRLENLYYYAVSRFLNASSDNTLPTPYSIPLDIFNKGMIVAYVQSYVYEASYGGSILEWSALSGAGWPSRNLNASPVGDKQAYILGPNYPEYISFSASGAYSSSRESFNNPPIYHNYDGETMTLPNGRYFVNSFGSIKTKYPLRRLHNSNLLYIERDSNRLQECETNLDFTGTLTTPNYYTGNDRIVNKKRLAETVNLCNIQEIFIRDLNG